MKINIVQSFKDLAHTVSIEKPAQDFLILGLHGMNTNAWLDAH